MFPASATSCSMCADCVLRDCESWVCKEEISRREDSAVLEFHEGAKGRGAGRLAFLVLVFLGEGGRGEEGGWQRTVLGRVCLRIV